MSIIYMKPLLMLRVTSLQIQKNTYLISILLNVYIRECILESAEFLMTFTKLSLS